MHASSCEMDLEIIWNHLFWGVFSSKKCGHFSIQREFIKFSWYGALWTFAYLHRLVKMFHRVLKPPPGPCQVRNLLCPFGVAKLVILSPKFMESWRRKIRWQQSCSTRPGVSTRSRHGGSLQRMACHVQQFMHRAIRRGHTSVRNLIRKRFFSRGPWGPTVAHG